MYVSWPLLLPQSHAYAGVAAQKKAIAGTFVSSTFFQMSNPFQQVPQFAVCSFAASWQTAADAEALSPTSRAQRWQHCERQVLLEQNRLLHEQLSAIQKQAAENRLQIQQQPPQQQIVSPPQRDNERFQYEVPSNGHCFESMRLMQYANGIRDASNPPQMAGHPVIAVLNPPTQVFGRTIFGSHTPIVFTQQPSQLADQHFVGPFGAAIAPPFGAEASGAAAAGTASSQQHLADERLALQLQHELWAQDNAGQSVPRAAAPPRNAPHHPDGEQERSVLARRVPGRRSSSGHSSGPPVAVVAPNPQMPSMRQIRPLGGAPVAPIADLPPHVAPILIAEAIKQKQQCSISLDDISTENACITTCAHIFSKDSIKEWLSRDSTCPQCRKPCRINGEPAAAPAHASHQPPLAPPSGFGQFASPPPFAQPAFGPSFGSPFAFGGPVFIQEQHQAAGGFF